MPVTPGWTMDEYLALKAALGTGATSISYNGRTVTYRSVQEMREILNQMERELNPPPASVARKNAGFSTVKIRFKSGYRDGI